VIILAFDKKDAIEVTATSPGVKEFEQKFSKYSWITEQMS